MPPPMSTYSRLLDHGMDDGLADDESEHGNLQQMKRPNSHSASSSPQPQTKRRRNSHILQGLDSTQIITTPSTQGQGQGHATRQAVHGLSQADYDMKYHPMDPVVRPGLTRRRRGLDSPEPRWRSNEEDSPDSQPRSDFGSESETSDLDTPRRPRAQRLPKARLPDPKASQHSSRKAAQVPHNYLKSYHPQYDALVKGSRRTSTNGKKAPKSPQQKKKEAQGPDKTILVMSSSETEVESEEESNVPPAVQHPLKKRPGVRKTAQRYQPNDPHSSQLQGDKNESDHDEELDGRVDGDGVTAPAHDDSASDGDDFGRLGAEVDEQVDHFQKSSSHAGILGDEDREIPDSHRESICSSPHQGSDHALGTRIIDGPLLMPNTNDALLTFNTEGAGLSLIESEPAAILDKLEAEKDFEADAHINNIEAETAQLSQEIPPPSQMLHNALEDPSLIVAPPSVQHDNLSGMRAAPIRQAFTSLNGTPPAAFQYIDPSKLIKTSSEADDGELAQSGGIRRVSNETTSTATFAGNDEEEAEEEEEEEDPTPPKSTSPVHTTSDPMSGSPPPPSQEWNHIPPGFRL